MTTKDDQIVFTLFTSTYNRAHTIHRVWESLNAQTFKNFEWIVLDNLSDDNIKEILDDYQQKATFPTTVIYNEENLGKHNAFNKAVALAKGKFFIPADADDSFIPESLEFYYNTWMDIPDEKKEFVSGINVVCFNPETKEISGTPYPFSPYYTDNMELLYKYHIKDEKWGMIRTDLLRKYPFPDFKPRIGHFIDNYAWFTFAKEGFQVLCLNKPLRYYYTDTGNSVQRIADINPYDASDIKYYFHRWNMNNNIRYIFKLGGFMPVLKELVNIIRFGSFEGKSFRMILKESESGLVRFLITLLFPITYLVYFSSLKKYKVQLNN